MDKERVLQQSKAAAYLETVGRDGIPASAAVDGIEQLVRAPQLQNVICLRVVHILKAS